MSLRTIAYPQSESELSLMLYTLEAHRIPAFIQGAGFGSLYPGPQIASYNARRIMVPRTFAAQAEVALREFSTQIEPVKSARTSVLNMLRVFFEYLLFGWFVPGNRRNPTKRAQHENTKHRDLLESGESPAQ